MTALSPSGSETQLQPVSICLKKAGGLTTCKRETFWNQPWGHMQREIIVMEDVSSDMLTSGLSGLHITFCVHSLPTAKLLQF